MADWTTIADAQVDPKAPVTSELMTALRDNPSAIAEGSTGATRIYGGALAVPDDGLDVLTITAADTYSRLAPLGSGYVAGSLTTNSGSEVVGATYTIVSYTGSMRFTCVHENTGSTLSTLAIYKNGTLVQSWSQSGGTVTRTADVTIVPTDVVEWRHSVGVGPGSGDSTLSPTVKADDMYVVATAAVKASENYYE